jgi:hypothetical protein
MMSRLLLCLLFISGAVAGVARADAGDWDVVAVPPIKTSIYVGSVTLTTSLFQRTGDQFDATYEARVWPWFFWNETGRITIRMPQAELERLARGERIEFAGDATNHKGKPRHVTGRADRTDAANGRIKVRIGVDDTELIFNGTYRFPNAVK